MMKHDDVWHVLPFLANGTLRGQSREDVEAHLAVCAECRAELTSQTLVRDTLLREDERQETAQASFDKLWDRILEDEAVAEGRAARLIPANDAAMTSRASSTGRVMKWLVAAVIVEGIGLGTLGAMTWSNSQSLSGPAEYRTLSSPTSPGTEGQIRVVFAPDLGLAELQRLLLTSRLGIVSGPTEAGVYTLALEDTNGNVSNALAHLRGSASVRFAEPIGKGRAAER